MGKSHVRAGLLVRISDAKGEEAGVARQEQDCRDLAARLSWPVAEVYAENDTSAFKQRRVTLPDGRVGLRVIRPEFRRLLDDMAAGAINALVAYDLDRVARDPRDLEDLIEARNLYGVQIRSITGSLDLSTDAGISMARVMVAIANKSSMDTARRVARKQEELAQHGKPKGGGIRPFGYEPDGMTIRKAEAKVIKQMAADILAGKSLDAIAKDLTQRGVPTVKGNPTWNRRSVHSAVSKPRNAGLRTFRGEVVGEAAWPAILDRDTWERVLVVLGTRAEGHGNQLKRWLAGNLVCPDCDLRMGASPIRGSYRYMCLASRGGCSKRSIDGPGAEATVRDMVLGILQREDILADLQAATSSSAADAARAEIAADEAQLKELAEAWASRAISMPEYLAARKVIEERLENWRGVAKASLPSALRQLVAGDIEKTWEGYGPTEKHEVVKLLMPQGIHVLPRRDGAPRRYDGTRLVPVDWDL